jgi:hypothetical protein
MRLDGDLVAAEPTYTTEAEALAVGIVLATSGAGTADVQIVRFAAVGDTWTVESTRPVRSGGVA